MVKFIQLLWFDMQGAEDLVLPDHYSLNTVRKKSFKLLCVIECWMKIMFAIVFHGLKWM